MNELEAAMARLLGLDLEAEQAKRQQEFTDYAHLLSTMSVTEFSGEVVRRFGLDVHQAAIILLIVARLERLEEE